MQQGILVLRPQPVRDHPDAALVTLEGSIDPKTVNQFKDAMENLAAAGTKRFLVDCARLTYVNSSGLAYLLNLAGNVKAKGGMVALAAVDSKILVIFNMMGITSLFQFYPTFKDAVRELDAKLAAELADVGPALKLEEPPKPPPPRPAPPPARTKPRTERMPMAVRPRIAAPPVNPIVQFFRSLFGIEEPRTRGITRIRRKR